MYCQIFKKKSKNVPTNFTNIKSSEKSIVKYYKNMKVSKKNSNLRKPLSAHNNGAVSISRT